MTTEKFIKEARIVHGDKYDYSEVVYKSTHDKVIINCPIHGDFEQSPANHLRKQGCDKCADSLNGFRQRKSTEQFINEAKNIFGNEYNYDKTHYITNQTKVIITCKIHGDFFKTPLKHISSKQGCPKCAEINGREKRKVTLSGFLKKVEVKFDDNFDFPKIQRQFNGIKSKDKITIICKKCGTEYNLAPFIFLRSNGCTKCLMYDLNKPPQGQSLGDLYPNSVKMWGNNGNYTPFDFYPNSGRMMKWICPTCSNVYTRSIQVQFVRRNIGCKNCRSRVFYTEKKILFELKTFFPNIVGDGIGRQVDIFIPSLNLIIEYDGLNWHKGEDKYKKDKRKTDKLIEDGYNVIRLREKPLEKITNNDIIIDKINQNSNRLQAQSLKSVVGQILESIGQSKKIIEEYLSNDFLAGEQDYNDWLDLFNSIPKDELEYNYIKLNKTKIEILALYDISIYRLNHLLIRYKLQKEIGNHGRKPPNRKDPSKEESKQIVSLYNSGASLKIISKSMNYSNGAIVRTLNSYNVSLRTNLHNEKEVIQKNLNGQFIKQYKSLKEASDETGIARPNISHCCIGTKKMAGGFQWEYLINNE
jgi:hypothetical protein